MDKYEKNNFYNEIVIIFFIYKFAGEIINASNQNYYL